MGLSLPEGLSDNELRTWLIDKINRIDAEKRVIKSQTDRHDSGQNGRELAWRQLSVKKINHLKYEREHYRMSLGDVNQRLRAVRALKHRGSQPVDVCQAFVALAQRHMNNDDFKWLWKQAECLTKNSEC